MDGNILVSVLYDVYEPCALYFRETEANNGVHVWEASHQRRHDHGHQTGETYGSHEQGQALKLCSPVLSLPDCNLISCLNDPTKMSIFHLQSQQRTVVLALCVCVCRRPAVTFLRGEYHPRRANDKNDLDYYGKNPFYSGRK